MPDAPVVSTSLHPAGSLSDQWGPAIAWGAWTVACTATLALFALRVKVSAQFPAPQEDHAFLAVQIAALMLGSWLAPLLLGERHRAVFAIATIIPILLVAQSLRNLPVTDALPGLALTAAWLAAFHWGTQWRWIGALFALTSVLGPMLWYLSQEFSPTPFHLSHPLAAISPPLGAAATSLHDGTFRTALWPILALGLAHFVALVVRQRRSSVT